MSKINHVSYKVFVTTDVASGLHQQQRSSGNERYEKAMDGKSDVNRYYHQSAGQLRQKRSPGTSVQKRNVESRVRELKHYMETIVSKDRGISSVVYQSFNSRINNVLQEIGKWTDSNEEQQWRKVEEMLAVMQQMPWHSNYKESQKSDKASRNSHIGVYTRLSDLRAVKHISYLSPAITGEQMMTIGKKKLQQEITDIVNRLNYYVRNNPSMVPRDKTCLLLELERLKQCINTTSQSSDPEQFRSHLDNLRAQVRVLQQNQMCSMMRAEDVERKMSVKTIISNYFNDVIIQIDKIKFSPVVEGGTRIIITGEQKVLTTLRLDDGSSMTSEWIITPETREEIPLR